MAVHEIALHLAAESGPCEEKLDELREQLGADSVAEPDETGMFAVEAEGATFDDAVAHVRDAIAAIGGDECFELGESSGFVPADE